jgi:hypothetical protein
MDMRYGGGLSQSRHTLPRQLRPGPAHPGSDAGPVELIRLNRLKRCTERRAPSQAHHLRFAQPRALGSKVSDEWMVPLCDLHHRALHDTGNEEIWWEAHNIDAAAEAERLWDARRPPSANGIGTVDDRASLTSRRE